MKKINKLIGKNQGLTNIVIEEKFDNNIKLKFTAKKIAFKIFYELKKNNLTQKDFATMLNVTPQNINKLLKGEDFKVSTLVKIEEALSINLIDRDIHQTIERSYIVHVQVLEQKNKVAQIQNNFNLVNSFFDNANSFIEKNVFNNSVLLEGSISEKFNYEI
jgi:transcriptional regulator with XRE-family HTH domain